MMDARGIIYNLKEAGRVGPRTMMALLDHFGSPEEVWEAEAEEMLKLPRIGEKTVERIIEGRLRYEETQQQLEGCEEQGVRVFTIVDPDYPEKLRQLGDPPLVLYVRGREDLPTGPAVAVVGTHEADVDGIRAAESWGEQIARREGVVISGLARGIDAAAHVGTIQAGGLTVGVLGCGFTKMYPPEHSELAGQIGESGAVVSEYSLKTRVAVGRLMARNRIVVGLADVVLIIQVHQSSSGTMDAARRAEAQGKPLFVLYRNKIPQIGQLKACGAVVLDQKDGVDLMLNYL